MTKKLIVINGTMGVGKTAVSQQLYNSLEGSVWLDGDWCWMMNPWVINEENIAMVKNNIIYLLSNYLINSNFEIIIFCWVIHKQEIMDEILDHLKIFRFDLFFFSLMCSKEELKKRMLKEHCSEEQILYSQNRLSLYELISSSKIDTNSKSVEEIVCEIKNIIHN